MVVLVIPIGQVGCVRFVDPPVTPLMIVRSIEARFAGRASAARRYEWIDLPRIPRTFLRCALTSEDQRFFSHNGFDWYEIRLSQREAERTGRSARGASTITMQCARSMFLWQGRSWLRKAFEAYYTFWMEALLPKSRILELYVNVIEMGDGIYGVRAASQAYFSTAPSELTREQAALIVAALPNPRQWNPAAPTRNLQMRAARILRNEPALKVPASFVSR